MTSKAAEFDYVKWMANANPIEDGVVRYDDLIEDQVEATEAMLRDDTDQPCKGCSEPVPVPKVLLGIVDVVYCEDCAKALLWEELGR